MLATMQRLGVAHSRSRPAVSNDNPYSGSLFKTLKYRPQLPLKPFADLLHARRWVTELVHWYNEEHRHSAISFVSPAQRHAQTDEAMLQARAAVYEKARQRNPMRWLGGAMLGGCPGHDQPFPHVRKISYCLIVWRLNTARIQVKRIKE